MFIYDFKAERLKRQRYNTEATKHLLLTNGPLNELSKVANVKALKRAAEYFGMTFEELRKKCIDNPDFVFGLDLYCSINAGRQSSRDELAIFKGLDLHLPHMLFYLNN